MEYKVYKMMLVLDLGYKHVIYYSVMCHFSPFLIESSNNLHDSHASSTL